MGIMRFDPFRELERVTEQMLGGGSRGSGGARSFPMDAYRRGDKFYVHLDLPGVDRDSIDLTAEQNVLTVRAERRFDSQEGDEILVNERPQGTFARQLFLSEALDSDNIEATYDQGVLTLAIPVAEQAKPKRIQVSNVGGGPTTIEGSATRSETEQQQES